VCHSSITVEEVSSIERVQKTALRIILRENYTDYSSALQLTGLDRLHERRTKLSLTFAKKCLKSKKNEDLFPLNVKLVNTRQHEKYFVTPARTERLAKSAVPLSLSLSLSLSDRQVEGRRDAQAHSMVCPGYTEVRQNLDLENDKDLVTYFGRVVKKRLETKEDEEC
jgi:hypothetical protein